MNQCIISTSHTKMGLPSTSHLDTSAKVPGNAGHRSAPHESPQDWLGPRSEVVARVDVESVTKGYGKTTKLEVVDSFFFGQKMFG